MIRVLVVLISLSLLGCAEEEAQFVALGTLEVDRVSLVADSNEPITEIAVVEGDAVEPGQLIARQDEARINAAMMGVKAALAQAKAELAEAEAGPRAQDIAAARAQVAAASSEMKTAKIELERERSLVKQNYASQNRVDILEGRFESAVARKEEADAVLAQLLEGTRSEAIDAARSRFANAQSKVQDAMISLSRTALRSPVAGKVEAVLYEVGERPGALSVVATILREQVPYARVHVPQLLRAKLATGAQAEIVIDGHSGRFKGRLRWIAHDASFTPYYSLTQHDRSHLSYLAEVDMIDERAPEIATGVPVQVTFPGAKEDNPRALRD